MENIRCWPRQPSKLPDRPCAAGGSLCHKGQFEVVGDAIDRGIVGDEGYNAHPTLAFRTDQGLDFINLADHLGPT